MSNEALPIIQVQHVMTRNPVVVHGEDEAEPLLDLFEGQDFNAVPVVDSQGHLQGMVTKLSLLRLFRVGSAAGDRPEGLRVRDIMDSRKTWVEAADGLDVVVQRMTRYHVRSVPVVARSGTRLQLVGIASYRDLLRMIARQRTSR